MSNHEEQSDAGIAAAPADDPGSAGQDVANPGEEATTGEIPSLYHPEPMACDSLIARLTGADLDLCRRGIAALWNGESETALAGLRQLHEQYPDDGPLCHNLGLALVQLNQYKQAFHMFQRAHDLDSSLAASRINSVPVGMEMLKESIEVPDFEEQVNAFLEEGKAEEAIPVIESFRQEHPNSSAAEANIAMALCFLSDLDGAQQHADRCLFLDPESAKGYGALSMVLQSSGRDLEALDAGIKALDLADSVSVEAIRFYLSQAYQLACEAETDRDLWERVIGLCNRMLELDPADKAALLLRGRSCGLRDLYVGGDHMEAIADLERVVALDPDFEDAAEILDSMRSMQAEIRDRQRGKEPAPAGQGAVGVHAIRTSIQHGDLAAVQAAYDHVKDEKPESEWRNEMLIVACACGHLEIVEFLLSRGAQVTYSNEEGTTPLHYAAHVAHVGLVRRLLDSGADPNSRDGRGGSPLHRATRIHDEDEDPAVAERHRQIVRILIEHGADINAADQSGETPLITAASNSDVTYVLGRDELERLAEEDDYEKSSRKTDPSVRMVNLLVEKGANVDARDEFGFTALHSAITSSPMEVIAALVQAGADLSITEKQGTTPADLARYTGRIRVAAFLSQSSSHTRGPVASMASQSATTAAAAPGVPAGSVAAVQGSQGLAREPGRATGARNTKVCPRCGNQYPDEYAFCERDSAPLVPIAVGESPKPPSPGHSIPLAWAIPMAVLGLLLVAIVVFVLARENNPQVAGTANRPGTGNAAGAVSPAPATSGGANETGSASETSTEPSTPTRTPSIKTVPGVVGMVASEAAVSIRRNGLNVETTREPNAEVGAGRVISQTPSSGAELSPGSTVRLTVSDGPPNTPDQDAIINLINQWRNGWEAKDIEAYMSHYTPDARVFTNNQWVTYDELYADERAKFARGGEISVTFKDIVVDVTRDTATVSCRMRFRRTGGSLPPLNRGGIQHFNLLRDGGRWRITEDRFERD